MSFRTQTLPDPARSDADYATFRTSRLGGLDRDNAVEAIANAWDSRPWPSPELLSYNVFSASDRLLYFAQWAGTQRVEPSGYRLHRGAVTQPGRDAGCIVVVVRVFDPPDREQARAMVDTLFGSTTNEPPADGMIAAHFFVNVDGSRVLNYAQWTSEQAHQAAIDNRPPQIESNQQWRRAHDWPGLKSTEFARYLPRLQLIPQPS